ncbi:hypothetical protein [Shewanella aestuarii]|uniref:Uncharacterized protein n=1 Tax=Shewanella aestuarii TaxID=1028752 RepID=A0A6G9QHF1_9GAMM|nr:hypothetical protein [Shewanella aestuarii]QIR13573.1 hypothetical protein HBH39_02825 [Shewanella aestuarii]
MRSEFKTRLKWAELWFRALGYNEDYWYYCCDMRRFSISEEYECQDNYLHLKQVYDFFGDIFVNVPEDDLYTDALTEGMLKNWHSAFHIWLHDNVHKVIPLEIKDCVIIDDDILSDNQPVLKLFQVGSWDSNNKQKAVEKQLDVFHMWYIERLQSKDILIKGMTSGKECWEDDFDKYLKHICIKRENDYRVRLKKITDRIRKLRASSKSQNRLMTSKQRKYFSNLLRAHRKKGKYRFEDVRGIWDSQFKGKQHLYYSVVNSAITSNFPSTAIDL